MPMQYKISDEIISRKEARNKGLKHYFTGKFCLNGHIEKRYVKCGRCLSCCNDWGLKYYYDKHEENKEKSKFRMRAKNGFGKLLDSPRYKAKISGATRYFTGKPCLNGHISERLTINGNCSKCMYERREKYWDENPDTYYQMLSDKNARVQADPRQRLMRNLRGRLTRAIHGDFRAGSAVHDLGCSIEEFKIYIEKQFKFGMSWENWGKTTWHLDHKKPLALFDLSDRKQLLIACHYTNYQPLWAKDNLKKNCHAYT